ncbi:hypothetical protein EH228_04535 [Erwinia endophytica]|uniref:hypothetical protein n=1 Tax=Erwinia endophytica TaxID=1563158 RepID=UPI001265F47C|nr:hypothetical protein [Erwinia endophytica]KAB8312949.1 hypothetical protein EH228_04535 [Erwinia endophytica]
MSELRAGGLAILIGGDPEAVGTVVTTVRLVASSEVIALPNGRKFSNGGSVRWLIYSEKLQVRLGDGTLLNDWALCFSHFLMPIDGNDFQREGERQKELTNG